MPKRRTTIAVLATLDTKGPEASYLAQRVKEAGCRPVMMDIGLRPALGFPGDISRGHVARAAGQRVRGLVERVGREEAVRVMAQGARHLLQRMAAAGKLDGMVALGGSVGTSMAMEASAGLPLGLPKVLVTTLPPGAIGQGQCAADMVVMPCPVDLVGLNAITRRTIAQAAAAVAGMASVPWEWGAEAPVVGVTCLGVVTPGVMQVKAMLERRGVEVVVFHGVTNVDTVMRQLVSGSQVVGEVRVAAMDILMELLSGQASAVHPPGEHPVVYAPGALDMLIVRSERASSAQYAGRAMIRHSPLVTLIRTTDEEARQLARLLAQKIRQLGPRARVVVPLRGFSMHSAPGERFAAPEVDGAFIEELRKQLPPGLPPREVEANINDRAFARALARELWALMGTGPKHARPRGATTSRR